jgi:hypothetical protein
MNFQNLVNARWTCTFRGSLHYIEYIIYCGFINTVDLYIHLSYFHPFQQFFIQIDKFHPFFIHYSSNLPTLYNVEEIVWPTVYVVFIVVTKAIYALWLEEKSQPVQCHFTLGLKHDEWPRPQMNENMTCNPTCHEMDKDSWSLRFCSETTSKGCLAEFFRWPSHPNKIWLVLSNHFGPFKSFWSFQIIF